MIQLNFPRGRQDFVDFLEERHSQMTDKAESAIFLSCIERAKSHETSVSPLASLARLVEACDAIENGEAAKLAQTYKKDTDRLRLGRTPLNSRTIDAYIRLRQFVDTKTGVASEWSGPRDATLRRPGDLRQYLTVRQERILSKGRPSKSSQSRQLEEIVGSVNPVEARQALRFALDEGIKASRQYSLLKKSISTYFPSVNLNDLIVDGRVRPLEANHSLSIDDEQKRVLAQLLNRLKNNEELRHFGLHFDGSRIKLARSPGSNFISKLEIEALQTLIGLAE